MVWILSYMAGTVLMSIEYSNLDRCYQVRDTLVQQGKVIVKDCELQNND